MAQLLFLWPQIIRSRGALLLAPKLTYVDVRPSAEGKRLMGVHNSFRELEESDELFGNQCSR